MRIERLIADRITGSRENKGNISRPIVKTGITGIAVGMVVMLLTISIVPGFKKEIVRRITGLTTHIVISNYSEGGSTEQDPMRLSAETMSRLRRLPFVRKIQPCAFKNGLLRTDEENEGILLKGVDADYDFTFFKEHLQDGGLPSLDGPDASPDIFVSAALAARLDLEIGQRIESHFVSNYTVYDSIAGEEIARSAHRSRKFTVCGIFKTDFADFDERLGIVDIRQIRRLNLWDSAAAGSYEILITDYGKLDEVAESVREVVGYDHDVRTVRETYSSIFVWLDKLDVNGVIIIVLMVAVAVMNMITALLILILERSNMIGLLKALGMANADVRKLFFLISLRLTAKGLLWGNIVGIGLCLLQYYFRIAKLESATYYVDYVAVDINWLWYLLLNAGTMLVCIMVLYLPTVVVTKLTPVRTLKFD